MLIPIIDVHPKAVKRVLFDNQLSTHYRNLLSTVGINILLVVGPDV